MAIALEGRLTLTAWTLSPLTSLVTIESLETAKEFLGVAVNACHDEVHCVIHRYTYPSSLSNLLYL